MGGQPEGQQRGGGRKRSSGVLDRATNLAVERGLDVEHSEAEWLSSAARFDRHKPHCCHDQRGGSRCDAITRDVFDCHEWHAPRH